MNAHPYVYIYSPAEYFCPEIYYKKKDKKKKKTTNAHMR